MTSKDHTHLNNLTQLRYLVLVEADRIIEQDSFPNFQQIFEVIHAANPPPLEYSWQEGRNKDDNNRLKSQKGGRGEAKVAVLNDSIMVTIERKRGRAAPAATEMKDDEYKEQRRALLTAMALKGRRRARKRIRAPSNICGFPYGHHTISRARGRFRRTKPNSRYDSTSGPLASTSSRPKSKLHRVVMMITTLVCLN